MKLKFIYPVILTLCFLSVTQGDTVDLFDYCGDGIGYDFMVSDSVRLAVSINGYSWPDNTDSCTVVFRAQRTLSDLYYKFTSFQLDDTGTDIKLESKYISFYTSEATYDQDNNPFIGLPYMTNRYLKVTLTRLDTDATSVYAGFDIYTDEYPSWTLSGGGIAGVSIGVIAFVVLAAIIFMASYNRYKRGANRGVVVAPAHHQVNMTTTTVTTSPGYGYTAPPVQLGVHPAYPLVQPAGYPLQSPAFISGQQQFSAPPAYVNPG